MPDRSDWVTDAHDVTRPLDEAKRLAWDSLVEGVVRMMSIAPDEFEDIARIIKSECEQQGLNSPF